jgi:hypothetical protein
MKRPKVPRSRAYGLGVEHARRRFLRRGARGSARSLGRPEIFNTDQGSQFTSDDFTGVLRRHEVTISMDGKGRCGAWLVFYNEERQHQSHGYRTPRQVYQAQSRWGCGRSALPTGCTSPASRASSKSEEMLAFAHFPTGTTTNTRIDQKGFDGRVTSASMAIGADIEIRGATL